MRERAFCGRISVGRENFALKTGARGRFGIVAFGVPRKDLASRERLHP
jgi:hypothetical protein